jgi:flotillin
MGDIGFYLICAAAAASVLAALIGVLLKCRRKAGPDQALIIYGRGGARIIIGGGAFLNPLAQRADVLDLTPRAVELASKGMYTRDGKRVRVKMSAQVQIVRTDEAIVAAAGQFLGRGLEYMDREVVRFLEGHLHSFVGTTELIDLFMDREKTAADIREAFNRGIQAAGIEITSISIDEMEDADGAL